MRFYLFSLIVIFLTSACSSSEDFGFPEPNKSCENVVKMAGIQCETQQPLLEFTNGSFGEVTNPEDFPEIFSNRESLDAGTQLFIGWEESSISQYPFIICNVGSTPSTYIKILCLTEE